jgi:LSD1 subclass zinc finger protein
MSVHPLYTCSRCKKEFEFEKIKYDEDKNLLCLDCLHQEHLLKKKNAKLEKEKPEDLGRNNFICMSCRFKFSIPKGSPQHLKCPYCGKTKLMLVKKYKDENDLINSAMDSRFDH